ncbi:hypothetical protein MKX75_16970 [Paenibacillus sp. FSL R5-0341]|uniref:hypothetical protein n=1 Tax=Paenibacillus sp. FSL R5-0341 TaxID=2921636 RepID=UPI0030D509C4
MLKKVHEETNLDFISMVSEQFEQKDSLLIELLKVLEDYELPSDLEEVDQLQDIYDLGWDKYDVITIRTKSRSIDNCTKVSREWVEKQKPKEVYIGPNEKIEDYKNYLVKAGEFNIYIIDHSKKNRYISIIREAK